MMHPELILDAPPRALQPRRPANKWTHYSDHVCQYLSVRYTERPVEVGIDTSVGSIGDSYCSALTETHIGTFNTELMHTHGP